MGKRKERRLTEKEQKVASNILTDYVIAHNDGGFNKDFFNRIMEQYGLCNDPFTQLPCTPKEYVYNSLEYDRQTMIQRYGHCDGLD